MSLNTDSCDRRTEKKSTGYWKWIIAFSCSWINIYLFSVFRSAGLFYGAFVQEFQCTHRQASWPISLAGSIASIMGIVAGFLTHYFDIRTIVFIGVFISSTSISLCYMATDIVYIIISLGFIQGVGIGLVTNLLPAIISQYFEKQRAIACGISYAGATTGAFMFPLFIEWQLKEFGLRGTLLLMGGISLHGLVGALLLRPFDTKKKKIIKNNKKCHLNDGTGMHNREPLIDECETVVFLHQNIEANHQYVNIEKLRERPKSIADLDKMVEMRDTSRLQIERNRAKRMSLPVFHERKVIRYLNQSLANQLNETNTCPPKIKYSLFEDLRRNASEDVKILFDIHFQLCTLTYLCFIIDFVVFIIVLPDFAADRGLTAHEGTLLLSLYSITDLFGRLIPGWISYLDFFSNRNIYITSIACMGICLVLLPSANGFLMFSTLTLICGFVTGCQMVLPAVVLSEYLGADRTAVAFGLSNFICGVLTIIIRPQLIGVKDRTGEYDTLFYILGSLAIGCALSWILKSIFSYIFIQK